MLGDEEHAEPVEEEEEVLMLTEEEALREVVTLRSEEAGVESARNTQVTLQLTDYFYYITW